MKKEILIITSTFYLLFGCASSKPHVLSGEIKPEQAQMQALNLCSGQNKIVDLKYRKKLTIWELGKNKFT
jgi:hypothetical protein